MGCPERFGKRLRDLPELPDIAQFMTWLRRGEKLVVFLRCLRVGESLKVRLGTTRVEQGSVILLERR